MFGATAHEELDWLKSGVLETLHPDIVVFGM